MCRLLETICIEDGQAPLLPYHAARIQRSRYDLLGRQDILDLQLVIAPLLSLHPRGLFKCRVLYHQRIEKVDILPYQRPQICSLKKVYDDNVDYAFKYENRNHLQQLYSQRGNCDDILIIKNGWVTDTYIGNLLLYDGQHWWTPNTELLKGVQRQYLLDRGIVRTASVREHDLINFQCFRFINALNPFETSEDCDISKIL